MQVGVFHIPNTLNLGSMMMAENFMYYAWSLSGGRLSFVVPTPKKEETERRLGMALNRKVPVICVQDTPQKGTWRKILKGTLSLKEVKDLLPPVLLNCDVFVVLGGDSFTESYDSVRPLVGLYKFFLFKAKLQKKIFLLGHTIGPFSRWRHPAAIHLLQKLDFITCRDSISYGYLRRNGLNNVALCADLAFLSLARENTNLKVEKTSCIIVPSRLLHRYIPYMSYNEYVDFWCTLLEMLTKNFGCKSVLLPHAMNSPLDDDRLAVKDIAIAMKKGGKFSNQLEVVDDLLFPYETRQTYFAEAMLTVTARMHAAISTLVRGGVPINIAYSEKSLGVIGQHFSLEDLVVDVRKFSSRRELEKKVCSVFQLLAKNYEAVARGIEAKIPFVQELSLQNIKLFLDKL